MPHNAVKGQILADLVAEFAKPLPKEKEGMPSMDEKLVGIVFPQGSTCWKAYVNNAANQMGSRVGLVLISPEGITIEKSLRLGFLATSNEAEYEALLEGMSMV